jgi:hypothetical protein
MISTLKGGTSPPFLETCLGMWECSSLGRILWLIRHGAYEGVTIRMLVFLTDTRVKEGSFQVLSVFVDKKILNLALISWFPHLLHEIHFSNCGQHVFI